MHEDLAFFVEESGFLRGGKPDVRNMLRTSKQKILDFCKGFSDLSSYHIMPRENSIHTHFASLSLGAGDEPCCHIECRFPKANELLQFASLYSDRVYIPNFLFNTFWLGTDTKNSSELKRRFLDDMLILAYLLPALKAGLIVPVTVGDICPHCFAVKGLTTTSKEEYDEACRAIEERFSDEISFSLISDRRQPYELLAVGPKTLLPPHGERVYIPNDPSDLVSKLPKVVAKLQNNKRVRLTKQEALTIGAGKELAQGTLRSIAFELGGAQLLRTSYLSDSTLEIEFIRNLTSDPVAHRRSALMQKYLNCLVPFLGNVKPNDLLKLRRNEQESFVLFRAALTRAVEEYKTASSTFSERDAQALYSDVVEPQLARLELQLKKAKRLFLKDVYRKGLGWVGALSVGLYTGFVTRNVLAGSAAFAASKVIAGTADHLMGASDVKENSREDDWYFLWQVRKKQRTV